MKRAVFISHSSREDELADLIRQRLGDLGVECWVDHQDIPAGKRWPDVVFDAVNDARVMVIILSQTADQSPFVLREVDLAVSKGVANIIPFRLLQSVPTGALKFFLCTQHYMDAHPPHQETMLGALISRIVEIIGAMAQPHVPDEESSPVGGSERRCRIDPSKREELSEFMRCCESDLEVAGYKGGCVDRVLCVLSELLSNSMEHGCRFASDQRIETVFKILKSHVKIAIEDSGSGFDVAATLERLRTSKDVLRARGRGLLLVEHLSERLVYQKNGSSVEAVVMRRMGAINAMPVDDKPTDRYVGDVAILRIPDRDTVPAGEIVDYLRPEFAMLKELGFLHFIIDWSSREAAGSDTMACLLNNWSEIVEQKGGSIVFINVSASFYHTLRVVLNQSGVARFFPIKRTLADALCYIKLSRGSNASCALE